MITVIYSTTTLAQKIFGRDEVTKADTRTLRKFLRDELGGGKAVVGKGARYALDLNANQIRSMKKKFSEWQVAQDEAKAARLAALATKVAPSTETEQVDDETGQAPDIDEMIAEIAEENSTEIETDEIEI